MENFSFAKPTRPTSSSSSSLTLKIILLRNRIDLPRSSFFLLVEDFRVSLPPREKTGGSTNRNRNSGEKRNWVKLDYPHKFFKGSFRGFRSNIRKIEIGNRRGIKDWSGIEQQVVARHEISLKGSFDRRNIFSIFKISFRDIFFLFLEREWHLLIEDFEKSEKLRFDYRRFNKRNNQMIISIFHSKKYTFVESMLLRFRRKGGRRSVGMVGRGRNNRPGTKATKLRLVDFIKRTIMSQPRALS